MQRILTRKTLVLGLSILFMMSSVLPNIGSIENNYKKVLAPLEFISFDPFKEGWFYQKQITIDHDMVDDDLTNFPALIHIVDSDLKHKAQNDGDDIIFMEGTGVSEKISHEIEMYNGSSGELICWVNIESLSSSVDTIFYMYYGNPVCENQEEITDTWNSNYVLVQHLNEASGIHYDSSMYGNHGTYENGSEQDAEGYIDGADGFDGNNDWVDCGRNESLNLTEEMTLEAWVYKIGDGTGKYLGIVGRALDTTAPKYNRYQLRYKPEDSVVHFFIGNDTEYTILTSDNDLTLEEWTHLVATWDGTNMYMFVDGVQQSNVTTFTGTPITTLSTLEIGRYWTINYFEGKIDEVRVSNIYREPSWITTEYNNQNDPSNFVTVGTEASYLPDWEYRKKVTIDHDMVEEDLSNFPIIIKTIDSDLAAKAQNDGDDILFIDNSGTQTKLYHEIEHFDGSTGELICWVNISTLSGSQDTEFYMYYGNPDCNSQQYPGGVWNNGFVMVQHLDETSGTHYDSTNYGNDGVCINGTDQNAEGFIDGADGFDGTNDWINCSNDDSFNLIDEITLEAWVNRTGDGDGIYLGIISRSGVGYNRYQLRYKPGDDVAQFFLGDGSGYTIIKSNDDLALDEWTHLVATWDGTNMFMFVNGVEQSNVSTFTGSPFTSSADLEIGRYTEQNYFQGIVDEIRISKISRDSDWIITEYNNQNDPSSFLTFGAEEGGENLPPTVEITYPEEGDIVNETVIITGISDDPDGTVEYVEVKIDDEGWETATGTTTWTKVWNTEEYSEGYHTVSARSYDGEDFSDNYTVNVIVNNEGNLPPTAPEIDGNKNGRVGETYLYEFVSTDPEGGDLYYEIKWGDGSSKDWFGPYESGKLVSVAKTWRTMGSFTIWARARDPEGLISNWGQLSVEIPRHRIFTNIFLELIFEYFPILARLLEILI
ncbi:hypothetical protein AYK21_04730 [Thermoplasmatales archaeon SG8-52-2]|nr:MAG: hypothetical protein AYK21_04730 [Thermoplasmatales archaeon SG8-52-2]